MRVDAQTAMHTQDSRTKGPNSTLAQHERSREISVRRERHGNNQQDNRMSHLIQDNPRHTEEGAKAYPCTRCHGVHPPEPLLLYFESTSGKIDGIFLDPISPDSHEPE